MLNKLASPLGAILLFIIVAASTAYFKAEKTIEQPINNSATAALFGTTLPDENGKQQKLNQWQGKMIVLNFWATWCGPCREEMPELSALHTEYLDKNVVVLGIALDKMSAIKEFTAETPVSYPLFAAEDIGGQLAANLGNDKSALPYTIIIKPNGSIANTYFGRISKALLEETLVKLL
ncbi:MAG: TlpA disulfide reductase family protein [Methylophilaceae bacterium]